MISVAWIIFGVLFFMFLIAALIAAFVIFNRLRWNFSYVLLEEQPNGKMMITRRGRARLMSFGDGGEEIFYLKGLKKWRVAYGKRIGKNQIAWGVGQDGYWYNIDFSGLDKKLKELGVYPVDRDMRYAYASARKGIDNRYDQKNFMDKYGTYIAFGMLFVCILLLGAVIWLFLHGQKEVSATNLQVVQAQKEVLSSVQNVTLATSEVLGRLANIKSLSGSGAVTVIPSTV